MKTTVYDENLIQLTRLGFINVYLVREPDGFTLIDTGIGGAASQIIAIAQQQGAPIVRIALTHAHLDHIGSLDALHAALPAAEISISAREDRLNRQDFTMDQGEPKLGGGRFPKTKTHATRLLHAGDRVGSLEVIPTPGHTPGHIAFYDHRTGALIAGDAMQTKGAVAVAGTMVPAFPLMAWGTWNQAIAAQSAHRLLALHPTVLAVGHGQLVRNPQAAIAHAIAVADRKAQHVAAA